MTENPNDKIAILDNCMVETLHDFMRDGKSIETSLGYYDRIIIPGWVWTEICDSRFRKQCVEDLQGKGFPIEILDEKNYLQIVDEELTLLNIFEEVIKPIVALKAVYRRDVLKGKPKEDIDYFYSEWIEIIYEKWPGEAKEIYNSEGQKRIQKQNAGEMSITFLAALLAYKESAEITIFTHDSDCKSYVQSIQNSTVLDGKLRVSYKNGDIILKEFYEKSIFDKDSIEQMIDKFHQVRNIIYVRKKNDGTSELVEKRMDAISFKDIVKDETIEIIW